MNNVYCLYIISRLWKITASTAEGSSKRRESNPWLPIWLQKQSLNNTASQQSSFYSLGLLYKIKGVSCFTRSKKSLFPRIFLKRKETTELRKLLGIFEHTFIHFESNPWLPIWLQKQSLNNRASQQSPFYSLGLLYKIKEVSCFTRSKKSFFPRIFLKGKETTEFRKLLGIFEHTFEEYKKNCPHKIIKYGGFISRFLERLVTCHSL